jgi:hypothetical protein
VVPLTFHQVIEIGNCFDTDFPGSRLPGVRYGLLFLDMDISDCILPGVTRRRLF